MCIKCILEKKKDNNNNDRTKYKIIFNKNFSKTKRKRNSIKFQIDTRKYRDFNSHIFPYINEFLSKSYTSEFDLLNTFFFFRINKIMQYILTNLNVDLMLECDKKVFGSFKYDLAGSEKSARMQNFRNVMIQSRKHLFTGIKSIYFFAVIRICNNCSRSKI